MAQPAMLEVYNVEENTERELAAGRDGQGSLLGNMLEDAAVALGGVISLWQPIKDGNVWHLRAHVAYP